MSIGDVDAPPSPDGRLMPSAANPSALLDGRFDIHGAQDRHADAHDQQQFHEFLHCVSLFAGAHIVPRASDGAGRVGRYPVAMGSRDTEPGASRGYRLLAYAVLGSTIAVIIGGDVVQATGSGAGCGESWPRCDGSLFPAIDEVATGIEFAHRASTFVLSLLVAGLFVATRRAFPGFHRIRRAMDYIVVFFVLEIAIGAMLVLFGWVEDDASIGRVVADSLHVGNTFLLVGAVALLIHYARGGRSVRMRLSRPLDRLLLTGVLVLVVIAITGAINSLADTLFPAGAVLEGVREEFGRAAPVLLRVRAVHPIVAIVAGSGLFGIARWLARSSSEPGLAKAVQVIIGAQFLLGVLNIALLTPLETQILHLLAAEILWITYLLLIWRRLEGTDRVPLEALQGAAP